MLFILTLNVLFMLLQYISLTPIQGELPAESSLCVEFQINFPIKRLCLIPFTTLRGVTKENAVVLIKI